MFVSKYNSGSGQPGSYRVQDVDGNIILVAVNRNQARFSVTWLNDLPAEQASANINLLGARVLTAWWEYKQENPTAPGVFFERGSTRR